MSFARNTRLSSLTSVTSLFHCSFLRRFDTFLASMQVAAKRLENPDHRWAKTEIDNLDKLPSHENVVPILHHQRLGNDYWIFMQYADLGDLRESVTLGNLKSTLVCTCVRVCVCVSVCPCLALKHDLCNGHSVSVCLSPPPPRSKCKEACGLKRYCQCDPMHTDHSFQFHQKARISELGATDAHNGGQHQSC